MGSPAATIATAVAVDTLACVLAIVVLGEAKVSQVKDDGHQPPDGVDGVARKLERPESAGNRTILSGLRRAYIGGRNE